jgi:hypothetical protein
MLRTAGSSQAPDAREIAAVAQMQGHR